MSITVEVRPDKLPTWEEWQALFPQLELMRRQLEEVTRERDDYRLAARVEADNFDDTKAELAAANQTIAAKDASLKFAQQQVFKMDEEIARRDARIAELRNELHFRCGYLLTGSVLATPDDDSALRRRLAEERERCAKVCDSAADNWPVDDNLAEGCAYEIRYKFMKSGA